MIDDDFVKALLEKCSYLSLRHREDCLTLDCPADSVIEFSRHLRDEETFDLLVDLTAVDQFFMEDRSPSIASSNRMTVL